MYDETPMQELVGKTVQRLWVGEAEAFLRFETEMGEVIYATEADCCSETWFADIVGVPFLLGATVTKTEVIEFPESWQQAHQDSRGRQSSDEFYGVKLHTTTGIVDIIYRNSSNGYYGGNIVLTDRAEVWEEDYPRKAKAHPTTWREITADWSA